MWPASLSPSEPGPCKDETLAASWQQGLHSFTPRCNCSIAVNYLASLPIRPPSLQPL